MRRRVLVLQPPRHMQLSKECTWTRPQFAKFTGSLSTRSWSKQRVPGRATLRSSSGGLPRPPLLERVGRSTCMGHFSKSFRSLREAPDTAPSCDVAPSSPWPANRLLLCERLLNPE